MRILLVNGSAYPSIGGVENSLRFIGRELLAVGHEVRILALQSSANEPRLLTHEGIQIIRLPHRATRWPHTRLRAMVKNVAQHAGAVISEFSPDAVWSRSSPVGWGVRLSGYSGPLLQIYATSAYMNCRGTYLATRGLPLKRRALLLGLMPFDYSMSRYIERQIYPRSLGVVFSENMKRNLQAAFPRTSPRLRVITPGVDSIFFSPNNGARYFKKIESSYGLRPDQPIVLYVGRLASAKNVPLLIEAVSQCRTMPLLVLVGSGPERLALKAHAQRCGIDSRLHLVGTHHEMLPGFYAMSRLCVLPTTIESFGQTYLEAMACGTPVVGFGGGAQRLMTATSEIIRDRITGRVVKTVSPEALAEAIDEIIAAESEEYRLMSEACRTEARDRFSWARFVREALAFQNNRSSEALDR